MGVELIEHQANHLRFRILLVDQPLHLVRKVLQGAPFGHHHMTPGGLGFTEHKEVGGSLAFIFIIIPGYLSGLRRQRVALLSNQLHAFLVKVDFGPTGIVGLSIEIQHVFQTRHKCRAYLGDAPLLVLPGLKGVFLSKHWTVSYESASQSPNSTALSASNRSVQRLRSPGAELQAPAINCASPLASSLGRWPGRGRSVRALRFSSTNRRRVRSTVGTLVPTSSAISSSLSPSSAFRRIRARVSLRTAVLPLRVSCTSSCRSAAVKATRYFFMCQACSSSPRCSRLYLFFTFSHQLQPD